MTASTRLSLERRLTALTIATIVGVAVDGCLPQIPWILIGGFDLLPSANVVAVYMFVGSFIAIPLCLLVGLPLWAWAERNGRRTRRDAIRTGVLAGLAIGLMMTALQVANGIQTWLDDSTSFTSSVMGIVLIVDGMPTVAGWLVEVLDIASYCIAGACAGLVARRIAFGRDRSLPRHTPAPATSDTDDRGETA